MYSSTSFFFALKKNVQSVISNYPMEEREQIREKLLHKFCPFMKNCIVLNLVILKQEIIFLLELQN